MSVSSVNPVSPPVSTRRPASPSFEHVSSSMSADLEQFCSSVLGGQPETAPALYAPPQKRRRTHPSTAAGVYVAHRPRDVQATRHSSLADSNDGHSSRLSDCSNESTVADDDLFHSPSHITFDDFMFDFQQETQEELLPGVTYADAELDQFLRATSPIDPPEPLPLPSLSTSDPVRPAQSEPVTHCGVEMAAATGAQNASQLDVVALPSPEQRIPAFYYEAPDIVMEEFDAPLPSPLQFSAAGSAAASPVEVFANRPSIDPRLINESAESARLVISAQPGPKSFLKASAEPPIFTISLELPRSASIASAVSVSSTADILGDNPPKELDKNGKAQFAILFNNAPALQVSRLFFSVDIETPRGRQTISSELSQPLVVRTNISQFLRAERIVLMDLLLGVCDMKDWTVASVLAGFEKHFAAWATERALAPSDLDLLCTMVSKGGRKPTSGFIEDLWTSWYGPMVKNFTDKNFRKLWQRNVIFGFLTRASTTQMLHEVARRIGATAIGATIAAFMDDSPLLTLASLQPDGNVDFRRIGVHEVKQPFRDIISESPLITSLVVRDPSVPAAAGNCLLRPKDEIVAVLLPKKMLPRA